MLCSDCSQQPILLLRKLSQSQDLHPNTLASASALLTAQLSALLKGCCISFHVFWNAWLLCVAFSIPCAWFLTHWAISKEWGHTQKEGIFVLSGSVSQRGNEIGGNHLRVWKGAACLLPGPWWKGPRANAIQGRFRASSGRIEEKKRMWEEPLEENNAWLCNGGTQIQTQMVGLTRCVFSHRLLKFSRSSVLTAAPQRCHCS